MKRIMARETLLAYPDFNKEFHIYTDASKVQLGAVIVQDGRPIAFFSRKLNPAQTRYTVTERELLSIVEVLKEFRNILLGQQIIVHTDHENLTYKQQNSDRVMRWRLYIEEYSPDLRHLPGKTNVVADALSRLEILAEPMEEAFFTEELRSELYCYNTDTLDKADYPLDYSQISQAQLSDNHLLQMKRKENSPYESHMFMFAGQQIPILCYKGKMVIPSTLQKRIIDWYHSYLGHPGINRTEESISQHLWWPKMRDQITTSVKACQICQRNKKQRKHYGHLPPKEAEAIPWDKLCVDTIGPYKIRRKGQTALTCQCVTMIDPATGWFELQQTPNLRSDTVANIVDQEWLCRYPWPTQITYDRHGSFVGAEFQAMLDDYGIKRKPITVRNPQANAICERVHQVIGNIIRTFELQTNYLNEDDPWKGILSATAFAIRCTYHTTLHSTPGQLVFGRDTIFNIKHTANWEVIRQHKQKLINANNKRENAKRIPHQYCAGDKVMLQIGTENKYEQPYTGPHTIIATHTNGTVTLQVGPVQDRVNIRRIHPHVETNPASRGGECNMPTTSRRTRP